MNPALWNGLAWTAQAPAAPTGGNPMNMMLMLGALFFIFYFVILRPQKREQRKREEMINQIGKGDQVLTSGGIYGTVESVDASKGIVTIAIAPKISVKFNRSAVATVVESRKRAGGADSAGESESATEKA